MQAGERPEISLETITREMWRLGLSPDSKGARPTALSALIERTQSLCLNMKPGRALHLFLTPGKWVKREVPAMLGLKQRKLTSGSTFEETDVCCNINRPQQRFRKQGNTPSLKIVGD